VTPCEECGEYLANFDPGNWWEVRLRDKTVTIPLHDKTCRSQWFFKQERIYSFRKDKRIEDVI
jgi:hypothetical protein